MSARNDDYSPPIGKDKKKSFFGRIFSFASHSMKLRKSEKESHKKKLKKSFELAAGVIALESRDAIDTCTFCDYCDREIVVPFTGQNIICHDFCKERNLESYKRKSYLADITASITSSNSADMYLKDVESDDTLTNRLASSAEDLRFSNLPFVDDATMDKSTISTYRFQPRVSISSVRNNLLLSSDCESYTFSTADISTIQKFGIAITKLPSFRKKELYKKSPETDKELISKPNDLFETPNLPDDLTNLIQIFNNNDQGLFIENVDNQVKGKVRVFINLLRPIKMLLTARPPSMFETFIDSDKSKSTIERAYYNKEVIFWLPRGTTNLLYIDLDCSTSDLITMLLTKFNIKNNPKKFALYEHHVTSPTEVEVRKFHPKQCPLKMMLQWCCYGEQEYQNNLMKKRFVLQENDPGSIEWDDFSIPELNSFLKILQLEELEKRQEILNKYRILKSEIERLHYLRKMSSK